MRVDNATSLNYHGICRVIGYLLQAVWESTVSNEAVVKLTLSNLGFVNVELLIVALGLNYTISYDAFFV